MVIVLTNHLRSLDLHYLQLLENRVKGLTNWSQCLCIGLSKERESNHNGWPLVWGSSMRVVISEAHTQSCVSCWQYCKSSDEGGRLLLRVRVLQICREGYIIVRCRCTEKNGINGCWTEWRLITVIVVEACLEHVNNCWVLLLSLLSLTFCQHITKTITHLLFLFSLYYV